MSKVPKVSVVIPTYNQSDYLSEAINSVRSQTFNDWEIIVINNYSEDDTVQVVESFADDRITLDNFSNEGVIAASRNRGINLSKGEYVAFLDSDDAWFPNKLMECVSHLENGADLVYHELECMGDRQGYIQSCRRQNATFDSLLDEGCYITTSATVVRKAILYDVGLFSESKNIVAAEDYHLWIKLAKADALMVCIKEVLGNYRVHSSNQSGSIIRHMNSILTVIREFMPADRLNSIGEKIRLSRRIGLVYYGAGRALQRSGRHKEAWPVLLRAVILSPFFLKNYVVLAMNIMSQTTAIFSHK